MTLTIPWRHLGDKSQGASGIDLTPKHGLEAPQRLLCLGAMS
jgi:hypothetical protein